MRSCRGRATELADQTVPDKMEDWEQNEQHPETWDSFPSYQVLAMQNAAHPVTTEVPPGYDHTTSWLKYSDAVEEWCDLTKVEAKRRGPAIAARLTGRAELFKERLDRERLKTQRQELSISCQSGSLLRQGRSVGLPV